MSTMLPDHAAPALDLFRRGDLNGARAAAETALATDPDSAGLHNLAGVAAARMGDLQGALPHFRAALNLAPDDAALRLNLATLLLETGDLDEAGTISAGGGDDPALLRVAAYVHQQQGRLAAAAAAYEAALGASPEDWESFNNLGNIHLAMDRPEAAVEAFNRALGVRPDRVEIVLNLSEALGRAERHEDRRAMMRKAAAIGADDARVQAELGLAEAAVRDYEAAERAFREAIRLDPRNLAAFLDLALLLENLNRVDDLVALADRAEANGLVAGETAFLHAWALRRQGRIEEALPLAEAVPETVNPIRRWHLIADLNDRLNRPERAFAAYAEMNAASLSARPAPPGRTYRAEIEAAAARTTSEWVAGWTPAAIDRDPPAPVFILGFPRSGTTLLDTLLMNLPDLHVLEEPPLLREIELGIPADRDAGALSADELNGARAYYFRRAAELAPAAPGRTLVDKHPLHGARLPLIHRLFPDARIVMVERHPCDAVLSCFMANFDLNHAMRGFTDLEEAARTYDAVFDAWTRAEALLPVKVHRVRYERMVADLEGEMRPLLDFLGLSWDPAVLDNQASAAARGHVRTASYAQVAEPIYTRAAGRWERYRAQMEPVLPILAPWAEKMGYPV